MANTKKIMTDWSETGKTVYCIIRREADSNYLQSADGTFGGTVSYNSMAENGTIKGRYELSESRTVWNDGRYTIATYKQAGGSPAPAADTMIGTGDMYIASDLEAVLDTQLSTRLATTGYTAPDNTNIGLIKAKTDNLPTDPASNTEVDTRLAAGSYVAPDNTNIGLIKAKTDNLPADPASNTQVNTRLAAGSYVAPDNTNIGLIKAKTDALPTDPASNTEVATRLAAADYVASPSLAQIEGSTVLAKEATSQVILTAVSTVQGDSSAFFYVVDENSNPVPDASVTVMNASLLVLNRVLTDVDGVATVNLAQGTYNVLARKAGYNFPVAASFTVVPSATTFTITGTNLISAFPPVAPEQQLVTGIINKINGDPVEGQIVRFYITKKNTVANTTIVLSDLIEATTDASGIFATPLIKGLTVRVEIGSSVLKEFYVDPTLDINDLGTYIIGG